jgi:transcriptional regulator with XRE-family HTH domain
MDPSFGGRLRLQRERHQVSLAEIAERTKIKLALLEGLERDDISNWPMGIFRRSYVRAYAQAIGLEPDTVVREFLDLYPDPFVEIPPALAAARTGQSARKRPPTRLRFLIGSALDALPALRAHAGYGRESATEPGAVDPADAVIGGPAVSPDTSVAARARSGATDLEALTGSDAVDMRRELSADSVEGAASSRRHASYADLATLAHLCHRLARAGESYDVVPVLEDAARLLDAAGLIVWIWDPRQHVLRHVLSLGYPDEVLAQLTGVPLDADNAIAASFRSCEPRVVNGIGSETGAIVVPLPTPAGCAGVLALETSAGGERHEHVRAFTVILAAQLSALIGYPDEAELTHEESLGASLGGSLLAHES